MAKRQRTNDKEIVIALVSPKIKDSQIGQVSQPKI